MSDPFDRAVEREKLARRRRYNKAAWRRMAIHARTYLLVNVLLAAIWAVEAVVENGHPLWFLHVAWGWGIGLFVHYVIVAQVTRQLWPRSNTTLTADSEPQHSQ